ncbi:MAG: glycosyltransferase family 4 protein, partial [Bacteroidaceae bacterium]|nr:glycosyltransferase family 4 protein [Bacteroidaceae bacterium]
LIFLSVIKKIKKIKLIIIVHDVFPENLIVSGISNESKLVYKIAKRLFNYSYNKGDKLITLGRDMQKQIQNKVYNKDKVICIQNFADTNNIFPSQKEKNNILIENKIVNKFIVLFTGNIGRMQNIDSLLETICILNNDDDIHFLFIGEGAFVEKMKSYINENSLSNITMLPNMSREKENEFLNAGDVGLVSLVPNVMGTGVPSKTYSYMAAGKPILAFLDEDSEIALMTKEENIGWVVNPNNPIELAEKIIEIKNNKDEVIIKSKKSREVAVEKYSLDIITEKYSIAIKSK